MKNNPARRKTPPGFTLIEMLVVILIAAMVIAVIGASLATGIRVWEEASSFGNVDGEIALVARMLEKDVANTFRFHDISFAGERTWMAFTGLVPMGDENSRGGSRWELGIGTVRYALSEGRLTRKAWAYPLKEPSSEREERIAANIESVEFAYFDPPQRAKDGTWMGKWNNPTNLPAAVRVSIGFKDSRGSRNLERVIILPAGGGA